MVYRSLILIAAAALVAAGCGSADSVPKHGADDQKAIDAYNAMTPQQHIDLILKGPMPQAAKDASIKKIKEQNHMQ